MSQFLWWPVLWNAEYMVLSPLRTCMCMWVLTNPTNLYSSNLNTKALFCFLRSKSSERLNCYDKARKIVDEKATLWAVGTITPLALFPGIWGYHKSSPTSHQGGRTNYRLLESSRKNTGFGYNCQCFERCQNIWKQASSQFVCLSWIALCI